MEETRQHKDSIDNRFKSTTGNLLIPSSFIRDFRYFDRKKGKEFFEGRNIDRYVCYGAIGLVEAARLGLYLYIIKDVYEKLFLL